MAGMLVFLTLAGPLLSEQKANSGFEVFRQGRFDESSEKIIKHFANLKLGMTPDQVRVAFPAHVVWESRRTDGNLEVGLGFQWQQDVFIEFYFRNTHPRRTEKDFMPSLASEHWQLTSAAAVRVKREIRDGHHSVIKRFKQPMVRYVFHAPEVKPGQ